MLLLTLLPAFLAIIVLIVMGIVYQNDDLIKRHIRWRNSLSGIETKITPATLRAAKLSGKVMIVTGIVLFFMIFYLASRISAYPTP